MKTPQQIEQLSNQALSSLDALQQVDANAYLYGKIINRMQQSRHQAAASNTRLMYRLTAALLLFLCINVTSYMLLTRKQPVNPGKAKAATGAAALSEEYFPKNDQYSY